MFQHLISYVQSHPGLSAALAMLPSILVALSSAPAPTDSPMGKLANACRTILSVFSVLTHKDSVGTLKLPGMTDAAFARATKPTGPANLKALAVLMAFGLTSAACHPIPQPGQPDASTAQALYNCAKQGVAAAAVDILPDVATALASGNYVGELALLVEKAGFDVVSCAVAYLTNEARADLAQVADPTAKTRAEHGRAWLAMQAADAGSR